MTTWEEGLAQQWLDFRAEQRPKQCRWRGKCWVDLGIVGWSRRWHRCLECKGQPVWSSEGVPPLKKRKT